MALDRQLVFNTVAPHLMRQNEKSEGAHGGENICFYRGSNGLRCAIGVLIPDELYSRDLETCTPRDGVVIRALDPKYGTVESEDEYFLLTLQEVHDNNPPVDWARKLIEFAATYSLNASIVRATALQLLVKESEAMGGYDLFPWRYDV